MKINVGATLDGKINLWIPREDECYTTEREVCVTLSRDEAVDLLKQLVGTVL